MLLSLDKVKMNKRNMAGTRPWKKCPLKNEPNCEAWTGEPLCVKCELAKQHWKEVDRAARGKR